MSRDLFIAMSLGDGALHNCGNLSIRHCLNQKEYIYWKADLLHSHGINHSDIKYVDSGKGYGVYEFSTYTSKFGKLLKRIMYTPFKKITKKLFERLDARGLAIWYMDIGSVSNSRSVDGEILRSVLTLTTCASKEDNQILIDVIFDKFGVSFNQRKMKNHYALVCSTQEARKFLKIVSPTVSLIECMKYKLIVKE